MVAWLLPLALSGHDLAHIALEDKPPHVPQLALALGIAVRHEMRLLLPSRLFAWFHVLSCGVHGLSLPNAHLEGRVVSHLFVTQVCTCSEAIYVSPAKCPLWCYTGDRLKSKFYCYKSLIHAATKNDCAAAH